MMVLLVDWLMFLILELIGILLGLSLFTLLHDKIPSVPSGEITSLFFYMYFWISVTGVVFSRNNEVFHQLILRIKEQLNNELQNTVSERTSELTKALDVKKEFLNNISHEIRAPIAAFSMAADSLEQGWDKLKEVQKYAMVKIIAQAANRIKNLSMHLINATKFQDSVSSLSMTKLNLTDIIRDFIDEAEALYLKEKKIKIKFACKDEVMVNADYEAIGQVVRNIVLNAIKFSPEKSTITVNLKQDKKNACVTVSDEGVGIPVDELDKIFGPFYQSSRTKTGAGGVGLGLNITKQIIDAHCGEIWAENNKKGSSFIFTLPLDRAKNNENKYTDSRSRIVNIDDSLLRKVTGDFWREGRNPIFVGAHLSIQKSDEPILQASGVYKYNKILVIDDEEPLIRTVEIGLSIHGGTEVIFALSGADGLRLLETLHSKIDAIVLDVMMPEMDGIKTLKIIKNKWPNLKVIMHSGVATEAERAQALKLGAHAFLTKPYKISKLIDLL